MKSEAYENCLSHLWTSVNVFCIVLCSVLTSLEIVAGIKGKHWLCPQGKEQRDYELSTQFSRITKSQLGEFWVIQLEKHFLKGLVSTHFVKPVGFSQYQAWREWLKSGLKVGWYTERSILDNGKCSLFQIVPVLLHISAENWNSTQFFSWGV